MDWGGVPSSNVKISVIVQNLKFQILFEFIFMISKQVFIIGKQAVSKIYGRHGRKLIYEK